MLVGVRFRLLTVFVGNASVTVAVNTTSCIYCFLEVCVCVTVEVMSEQTVLSYSSCLRLYYSLRGKAMNALQAVFTPLSSLCSWREVTLGWRIPEIAFVHLQGLC